MASAIGIDVNGEESFFVDKQVLSLFSRRLRKLLEKPSESGAIETVNLILHGFPGGAEAFELVTRFCYNNGNFQINPTNTCILHFVADFMEMTNLMKLTEKSLDSILYWSWSDVLTALKQCQDCFEAANSSGVLDKILDSLVGRIMSASETSPSGFSPESSALRFSCDTRSTISTKNGCNLAWWFEDLSVLNFDTISKAISCMVSKKLEHASISRFLFYYLKHRYLNATSDEKRQATEIVVDLLHSLDNKCVSCKGLFGILPVSSSLNVSKLCRNKLESMIGSQIDQATLDNLLVPAPYGMMNNSLYDVNLILRFLKYFLNNSEPILVSRLKRLGSLMDSYIAEIAPDPSLKPLKFAAITTALPDAARDSYDAVYQAIDMYLQVHPQLSEEEKVKICCCINFEKLSSESCKHLTQSLNFPSRTAIQALIFQNSKLKSLLQNTTNNNLKKFSRHSADNEQHVNLHANRLNLSMENEKLKSHLQGMQCRVMELEKVCRKMQTQLTQVKKTKLSSSSTAGRSLPRLCS
ncbi:NPH3 domain-containing protein [Dioscorea alata]|uniref:NPH3 domain-containing protein n=2 Tax=Dioscorea alata TaxID=55571 RepID=A0ACB7VNW6_DIOAL|nr:NPH3 domain-containing protein [Dioscorea alata]KAH7675742.1 NPH3 domain-containing protein [Dioscorea alata]